MKRICLFGIYNVFSLLVFPFFLLFLLTALFIRPAYRKNISQRFGWYPSVFFQVLKKKKTIWIHAASVGEVMMTRYFVQALKARYPDASFVLSTITPTGQHAAREHLHDIDLFIYFPFDLFWITRSLVRKIAPTLFIFMETEIWPNCLKSLSDRKTSSILANGRISTRSFPRYRRFRFFLSVVFDDVSLFLMQSKQDEDRIIALGASRDRVEHTGNMKYAQGAEGGGMIKPVQSLSGLGLLEGDLLMIAGSTRPGEEDAVLDAYEIALSAIPSLVLVIAPRHLERLDVVESRLLARGHLSIRKGRISGALRKSPGADVPVILIDTLGHLAEIYPLGTFIFVGGSLSPFGGHNILEPAACRKPVLFGPHMDNFREISIQLLKSGGGIEVANGREMGEKVVMLSKYPDVYQKKAVAAHRVVLSHKGAVQRNIERIARFMDCP